MTASSEQPASKRPRSRVRIFHDLMRRRVRRILLVSSLYDSFILTEDGQVNEALMRQYADLNLYENPDVARVSTGAEALTMAKEERRFDMIITSLQVGDMNAVELAQRVKEEGLDVPVVLGSATPSFESLENVHAERYTRLELPRRPGAARHPDIRLIDLRHQPCKDGLTEPLRAAIALMAARINKTRSNCQIMNRPPGVSSASTWGAR